MKLLCLIRFLAINKDPLPAWEAVELFAASLPDYGGQVIHREDLQAMVLFDDAALALALLSDTLDAGEREQFAVSAALAQGIRSKATLASSLSGFTEGSIETVFEVMSIAGKQEVAISHRLSSLIALSAPEYSKRFKPAVGQPDRKIRSALVMGPAHRQQHD
ncbi:MAG: hypothetical protein WA888_23430 [Burkholderiaceae bacterium]